MNSQPIPPPRIVPSPSRAEPTSSPSTTKTLMIIFTALWVGGILFGGVIGFWTVFSQYRQTGGGYMVHVDGSHYRSGEVFAGAMVVSFFTGLVCPTVVYAIAMTALMVIHFASKNLSTSDPQLRR